MWDDISFTFYHENLVKIDRVVFGDTCLKASNYSMSETFATVQVSRIIHRVNLIHSTIVLCLITFVNMCYHQR